MIGPTPAKAGGTVGTGTAASCTEAALSAAMASPGTVTFNCGPAPVTITLTNYYTLSSGSYVIDGGKQGLITLSGPSLGAIFYAAGSTSLAINNMVLRDTANIAVYGSGVSTSLTITNSTLRNNAVGGLRAEGSLTVTNSDFSYNTLYGLFVVNNASAITLSMVNASNNGQDGVDLAYTNQPVTINQLTADKNGRYGVSIGGTAATTTITDSIISNTLGANVSGAGLNINTSATVNVSNTQFLNNSADGYAGAIFEQVAGTLSITNCVFIGNTAKYSGGAIFAGGNVTLTVSGSTFTGNTAPLPNTSGGAIFLLKPISATISTSTFTNNQAHDTGGAVYAQLDTSQTLSFSGNTFTGNVAQTTDGGAIYVEGSSPFSVQGSTFQGNQAARIGGAIMSSVNTTISNSTFTGNSAVSGAAFSLVSSFASPIGTLINNTVTGNIATLNTNNGGAIDRHDTLFGSGTLTLQNTVVSSNTGGNCSTATVNGYAGPIGDNGNNIQYGDTSCGATIPVNNPLLGTLANNGGPTQTIAPGAGSPLIDAGSNTVCAAAPVSGVDQRGLPRTSAGSSTCDIGAYESPTIYTSCTLTNLDAAIAAGGGYYFACASPTTITIPATRTIGANIQIDSNGNLTLYSTLSATMLQISNTTTFVSLRNLNFQTNQSSGNDVAITNASTGTVWLSSDTFSKTGGFYTSGVGVLQQAGALILDHSTFASQGPGFGLRASAGTTIVTNSSFASQSRSAWAENAAALSITDSTITASSVVDIAVATYSSQPVRLKRTTLSGSAKLVGGSGSAGAIIQSSTVIGSSYSPLYFSGSGIQLYNTTVVNTATTNFGALFLSGAYGRIVNSTLVGSYAVVQGNSAAYARNSVFYGKGTALIATCQTVPMIDLGNNLQYPGTGCGSTIPSVDPKLGALQYVSVPYPTAYMMPFTGSPLIDAGNNDTCSAGPILNVDQRGFPRPLDGNGDTVAVCDIGAVEAPTVPTVVKSIVPGSGLMVVGGTATLRFTLQNQNSATNFTNVAFTDLLAPNVVIASPANVTNTCATPGTVDADPGSSTITVTGAGIPINTTCAITVDVTSSRAGLYNNTVSALSSLETGTTSTSNTVTLTVLSYPTVKNAFVPASIGVNNPTTLTFTLTNPNTANALSGVSFVDTLPANIQIAPTPNKTSTCAPSGGIAEGAGATTVTLSGAGIPANSSCTVTVDVIATATGTYTNSTGAVSSTETGAGSGSNTSSLLALSRPTVTVSAAPATIDTGSEATLRYVLTNPNAGVALTNLSFSHVLPSGVTFSATPLITTTCPAQGTVTPAGPTTMNIAGFGLGKGASCQITINVKGSASGGYSLAPATVTTTETGNGGIITPAALTVTSKPSIVNLVLGTQTIGLGSTTTLTFKVANTTGAALTNISVTTTLPTGLVIGDSAATNTCPTIGTLNASPRGASIAIAGVGVPASSTCAITVSIIGQVVSPPSGAYTFTSGPVFSTQTGTGATSNQVSVLVLDYPKVNAAFSPTVTGLNQIVALTYTLSNPNLARPLSAVGFTQTLPTGIQVAAAPNAVNTCSTPGTFSAPPNGSAISLTGAGLNPSETCTVTLRVTNSAVGAYSGGTSVITSAETGNGAASNAAALSVLGHPALAIGFAPNVFKVGGATTLSYTLTNPNAVALSSVLFKHTLPAGLQIASTPGVTNNCATPGTVSAPANGSVLSVSGLGMSASQTCTITVQITSAVAGLYTAQTDKIQANETGVGNRSNAAQVNVALYSCDSTGVDAAINNGGPATFACITPTTVTITAIKHVTKNSTIDGGGLLNLQPAIPPAPSRGPGPKVRDGRIYGGIMVDSGVVMRMSGVTITNNSNLSVTGMIVDGQAILTNVTFKNNTNAGALLIRAGAQASVFSSTFVGNSTHDSDGAAIYVESGPGSSLTVVNSTFSGNSAIGSGGAIYVETGSTAAIINSTFSGNSATVSGGALFAQGTITLSNSIIANSTSGGNCAATGTLTDNGSNLQYPLSSCGTTIPIADPQLSPLAANGGQTQTMALAATSPAIDAGNYAVCNTPPVRNVDQRGYLRLVSTLCDIGAYEFGAQPPALAVTMPTRVTVGIPFDVTVTAVDPTANTVTGYRGVVAFTSSDGAASTPEDYTFNDLDLGVRVFSVTLNSPGSQTVTVTDTASNTPPIIGTATTLVLAPPGASVSLSPSTIQAGQTSILQITLSNLNSTAPLSQIALQQALPTGVTLATDPGITSTCALTSLSAVPVDSTLSLLGANLPAGSSCNLTVRVTAGSAGAYPFQVSGISARETAAGGRSNTAVLTVTPSGPTVSAGFAPVAMRVNNLSKLTFTLWNPTAGVYSGVTFSAALPPQVTVSSPVTVTNTCSTPGTISTTSGVQVSGAGLTGGERCTISVSVTSLSAGTYAVQTGPLSTAQNGTGPASNNASLTVSVAKIDTIGIYRPSNNTFYFKLSNSTGPADFSVRFGSSPNHYPIVGDWNGDGVDTVGYYDRSEGRFYLRDTNTPGSADHTVLLGNPSDTPIAGRWTPDMNHDGVGVLRPSNGILYLKKDLTDGFSDYFAILGNPGDIGVAGDWDGNGYDSPGVYRPAESRFYLTNTSTPAGITFSDQALVFGVANLDAPVVGDWIGQGHAGVGVFRVSNGVIYLRNTLTQGYSDLNFVYGVSNDIPLAGHWVAGPVPPPPPGLLVLPGRVSPTKVPGDSNGFD